MTSFLAGHETTALNLSWTWMLLSQNPVAASLARELDEVLGARLPTLEDLPHLRYAGHVVAESLRMYPPAWTMGGDAREDVELGDYRIREGGQVWFCVHAERTVTLIVIQRPRPRRVTRNV